MGFVNGTCVKSTYVTSVPLSNQWERCNAVVLSCLLSSISEDLYLSQVYSENVAEVWKELKDTYDKLDGSILGGSSNNVEIQTPNVSLPFTNDQIAKLISLISEKENSGVQASMAGENQHITNSTKNMTNVVDISELNITVGHPNGTIAKITHVGNMKLTNNVVLFDVLVIPEYTVSLLSVNKMIKDSKLHVSFNEHDCVIQDLKNEYVLGTGSESGGL
ncbi:hypothetical protein Tco_0009270 [Tanacetum coccineum]